MLYIVRHGETSFNKRGLMCGNINAHLTESGKLVALALGDKLSHVKFDAAFRSPMYRTEETISCILQKNPFPVAVTVDPRIRERDYGYLEGETHKTQPEFNMRWHIDYDADRLKMESLDSLFSRVGSFMRFLKENYKGKNVLVVTHSGTIRAFRYLAGEGRDKTDLMDMGVDNSACVTLPL